MATIETFLSEQRAKFKAIPEYYSYIYDLYNILKDADLPSPTAKLNSSPEFFNDLKKLGESHAKGMSYFWQSLKGFTPVNFIEDDPEAQLKEIKSDKEVSGFKLGYEYISVKIKCEMYDPALNLSFNFGNFLISMHADSVVCEPVGENVFKDSFFHPYVCPNTYKLCLGDFDQPYKSYWRSMSYANCWFFVKKIMTQYGVDHDDSRGGSTAPFARFSAWVGNQCVDCGEIMPNNETFLCAATNSKVCSSCAESQKDEVTGIVYMSHFVDKCDVCESTRFDVRAVSDKRICRSCRSVIK